MGRKYDADKMESVVAAVKKRFHMDDSNRMKHQQVDWELAIW